MGDSSHEERPGPESRFRELRDRPTPELDSRGLWRRIEAGLTPRSRAASRGWLTWAGGEFPGFAYAAAAVVLLVAVGWIGYSALRPGGGDAQLVLLAPLGEPPDGAAAGAGPDARLRLDVRLVRAYDGAIPEDVATAAALGVGGADSLADARAQIRALVDFEGLGIVGAWDGEVEPGDALVAALSSGYELRAATATARRQPTPVLQLNDVELIGAGQQLVASDLNLEPGRLYIFGALPPDADVPSLILLVRAEWADGEARR